MKKSIIAILLSIMMISGSIGAVPVFASQPPAVQETADILAEEDGFSPESGSSAGEDPVLVDESAVVETGTNAAEDAAEEQSGQPAEEQMVGPSEEQPGQPEEEQMVEPSEEQPGQPVEEQVEEPSEEQIEQPAGEQTEVPVEEQVEETAEEQMEQPAEEQTEVPAGEPVEESAEEQTEEPAEEQVEEPFEDQAEQAAEDENVGEPAGTRSGSIESPADESIADGDVGEDNWEDAVQEEIPVPEELEQSEAMNDGGDAAGDDQVVSGSFAELQQMINECEVGGSITLERKYVAGPEEKALDLGSEGLKHITIYLNGYTIDRGLADSEAVDKGYVFLVYNDSTLELYGPGTITGGNNTGNGGGIFFEGYGSRLELHNGVSISGNKAKNGAGIYATGSSAADLWIDGATISGNTANNAGGGVYVNSGFNGFMMTEGSITENTAYTASAVYVGEEAQFVLTHVSPTDNSTEITGNSAENGPAVYLADNSSFEIYGCPVIKDNTSGGRSFNVNVPENYYIYVGSYLYDPAEIGVSTSATPGDDAPVVFTSGLSSNGHADASAFFSDSNDYQVVSTTEGEAALAVRPAYEVEISEIEHGSVSADPPRVYADDPVTLIVTPDAGYELATLTATYTPEGGEQQETIPLDPVWDDDTGNYTASFTMPAADVTVDAAFIDTGSWQELRRLLSAGGTVTLAKSYTAYPGAQPLEIPDGVSATLDLNGYDIDRGLTDLEAQADGSVIVNNGTLVIKNSGSGSGGNIKGGNTDGGGGGIRNFGTMTLEGGNITGNKAGTSGGGIHNTGTLTMTGGSILQNTAVSLHGGGIYNADSGTLMLSGGRIQDNEAQSGDSQGGGILQNGTMNVSGNPIVNCNTAQRGDNIYLCENHTTMNVTGPFTEGASLYVTKANGTGVITSGYGTYHNESPEEYFTAIGYRIITNDGSGEAEIVSSSGVVDYYERSWVNNSVSSTLKAHKATQVTSSVVGFSGWYYLDQNVTINGRVDLNGDTYLILGDGFTFDVKGLYIPQGSTLTIYSQSDGDNAGKIISHPGSVQGGAAIGGYSGNDNGNIVIHGGTIEARGYDHCAGIGTNDGKTGGDITIYGGKIKAIGGSDGAGIGGGRNCSGGTITIYGGEITANGPTDSDCSENGAGIGGGNCGDGGLINIYGGTIQTYSRDGAGIGGGDNGAGGNITINGGNITSTKVNQGQGARIGGGCDAAPGTITIGGGNITTIGGSGAGIGGGKANKSGGTVTITGGIIDASGSYGIGSGENGADVAITLDYTEETKGSISITASSYGGTVTLNQSFGKYTGNAGQNLDKIFMPGVVSDNSLLARGALKACDVEINSWQTLQMVIDGAPDGTTIKLDKDFAATYETDAALKVGSNKNIIIDLNGHTLNRGLTEYEAAVNGYVILNEGSLTITDSLGGGMITGGNCSDSAGGIYNSGTLTIISGSITGNKSAAWGGGIYLPDGTGAVLNLNGGSITNNICGSNGGGVHVSGTASMTVSGSPVVTGNKKNEIANNINLAENAVIQVAGSLDQGANLFVSSSGGAVVITSGYSVNNGTTDPETFFHADNAGYNIVLDTGEAKIDTVLNGIFYDELSWNGTATVSETKTANKVRAVPEDGGMTDGWYYLNNNVTVDGRVLLTGDTNLILGNGHTLDVKGIFVPQGSTLTIYAQRNDKDAGSIISTPAGGAAIGGYSQHDNGNIVIHGGVIKATGYDNCAGIGGNDSRLTGDITIYGGYITATGGSNGAGIGGGRNSTGGNISIYGGNIEAYAGDDGAGIGGGESAGGGNITIYYCDHIETLSKDGAGIGGGENGDAGTIKIHGGMIDAMAVGDAQGARIGGGNNGSGGSITITGGEVYSYCGDGAGIGGGEDGSGGTITISGGKIVARSDDGNIEGTGTDVSGDGCGAGIGGGNGGAGGNITITNGDITAYIVNGAGIGGGSGGAGGTINIKGGTIKTYSGNGAGIGGGKNGDGGTINIDGGNITANGSTDSNCGENGAGIGGGSGGAGGTITINGGTIQTYSRDGAGIGGGDDGAGGTITINGGTITSTKVNQGQGARIGGGCDAAPGTITIGGGNITTSGGSGAGIGGGKANKSGGTVTITGGIIDASGSYGIGAGESGSSVATTLGYTAATRDAISITASSYAGPVTLEQPFTDGSENFEPGGVTDLSLLANKTLTAWIPVVTIKGVTGSFNDKIKLNYYFIIPQILLSDQNAYVTLTNEKTGNSKTLYIKEAEYVEGKGHKFSILLAAKEARDTITAKVFDGQGGAAVIRGNLRDNDYTDTGVQYTLVQYLDWLAANEETTDEEKALGTAAKDYCTAAQIYFNYHAGGLAVSDAVGAVTEKMLSSYAASRSGTLPSGVSIRGISAMLESDNTLRLYLGFTDVEPSSLTYMIGGQSAELKKRSDGAYYLALNAGVYSNHLQDTNLYSISDGTNTYTLTMSVLTYARSCAIKSKETESNLGKALYLYNQAASAMFAN